MKITLTTLLLSALVLVGCADDSSFLTSPETQNTQQSNSPNFIQLPADLGLGFGVETEYSASKLIKGNTGGMIKLDVIILRPGNPLGDFEIHAKLTVQKNSFTANDNRTFTVSLDPEYCMLNITPSPSTLDKQLVIDLYVEGIDVSDINPETFSFIFIGDNSKILETTNEQLIVDYDENMVMVLNAWIYPLASVDILPDSRYGWIRYN